MTEEQIRSHFQSHLQQLGYDIEQTNPHFDFLLDLYKDGTLYEMWLTEFAPVFLWNVQAKALLEPYMIIRMN